MAKHHKKTASGLTSAQWHNCSGVNSRTGRVKRGYKTQRTGCPRKVPKS